MDREKLKLIIRNLESLIECLKTEFYSDTDSYKEDSYNQETQYEEIAPYIDDYDEVFYDDEDDFDLPSVNKKYKITNDDGDGL